MAYVLLIEPNTLLARMYAGALSHEGHIVLPAADAQSAIHAADMHQPDVVVLELQLPLHNGIEFLHEFRSYPEWQPIPVIVNTMQPPARLQVGEPALRAQLGVRAVLYKPMSTLADICRAVRQHMGDVS